MKKIKYLFRSKLVSRSKISDSIVFTACYSFVSKRNLVFVALYSFVHHGRLRPLLALNVRRAYPGCFLTLSVDVFGGQTIIFTLYCTIFLKKRKKKGVSSNFSNMKAYVVVRGSVANIRSIVDERGPEIIYFQCSK